MSITQLQRQPAAVYSARTPATYFPGAVWWVWFLHWQLSCSAAYIRYVIDRFGASGTEADEDGGSAPRDEGAPEARAAMDVGEDKERDQLAHALERLADVQRELAEGQRSLMSGQKQLAEQQARLVALMKQEVTPK